MKAANMAGLAKILSRIAKNAVNIFIHSVVMGSWNRWAKIESASNLNCYDDYTC